MNFKKSKTYKEYKKVRRFDTFNSFMMTLLALLIFFGLTLLVSIFILIFLFRSSELINYLLIIVVVALSAWLFLIKYFKSKDINKNKHLINFYFAINWTYNIIFIIIASLTSIIYLSEPFDDLYNSKFLISQLADFYTSQNGNSILLKIIGIIFLTITKVFIEILRILLHDKIKWSA